MARRQAYSDGRSSLRVRKRSQKSSSSHGGTSGAARTHRTVEDSAGCRILRSCPFNDFYLQENGGQNADKKIMTSISGIASSFLQSALSTALQNSGLTSATTPKNLSTTGTSSVTPTADTQQLSPFAQMMSTLQQLQQTDPTKYKQVTGEIATNLQSAAQTAQLQGNSTAASQLTQLSTDFKSASTSGQLPNVQDLAQATGSHSVGGHHHHHHAHPASTDSDSSSTTTSDSGSNSSLSQTLSQFLAAAQANGTQSDSLNPTAIILSTLSSAGISTSQG